MANDDLFNFRKLFPLGTISFLNLCKTRSYTKTAKELHTSQSSVSRSIADLENSLGFELIERDTRPIKITQAGLLLQQSLLKKNAFVPASHRRIMLLFFFPFLSCYAIAIATASSLP